jgi:hypothetical protein
VMSEKETRENVCAGIKRTSPESARPAVGSTSDAPPSNKKDKPDLSFTATTDDLKAFKKMKLGELI